MLKVQFFFGGQFITGRDPHHVAVFAHIETTGLQDDVQRLIPRHILQSKRQIAADSVTRNDIQISEIRNNLQDRAHFNVLEIE